MDTANLRMKKLLPYAEYFQTLPRKPIAAGALIFDKQGRLLILKATYRAGWIIPGGIVEEGESPTKACLREIQEELGLNLQLRKLICVDYKGATDKKIHDDSIQMIFDGGILSDVRIKQIHINQEEHSEFAFVSVKQSLSMLNPKLAKRIPFCLKALKAKTCVYLENGELIK